MTNESQLSQLSSAGDQAFSWAPAVQVHRLQFVVQKGPVLPGRVHWLRGFLLADPLTGVMVVRRSRVARTERTPMEEGHASRHVIRSLARRHALAEPNAFSTDTVDSLQGPLLRVGEWVLRTCEPDAVADTLTAVELLPPLAQHLAVSGVELLRVLASAGPCPDNPSHAALMSRAGPPASGLLDACLSLVGAGSAALVRAESLVRNEAELTDHLFELTLDTLWRLRGRLPGPVCGYDLRCLLQPSTFSARDAAHWVEDDGVESDEEERDAGPHIEVMGDDSGAVARIAAQLSAMIPEPLPVASRLRVRTWLGLLSLRYDQLILPRHGVLGSLSPVVQLACLLDRQGDSPTGESTGPAEFAPVEQDELEPCYFSESSASEG